MIIRNKKSKKYQATYVEENGKVSNDDSDAITLWGYQINKIFHKDYDKELGDIDAHLIPQVEVRRLNTRLIKQVFSSLLTTESADMYSPLIKKYIKSRSHSIDNISERDKSSGLVNHHETKATALISAIEASRFRENKDFYILRFIECNKEILTLNYEKVMSLSQTDVVNYYCYPTTDDNKSYRTDMRPQ